MWNWVVIVGCYAFAALFLRLVGGFNSAADAIANWGRNASARRIRRAGHTASTYARSRMRR